MPIKIGKRHVELATRWVPSAGIYSGAAGLGLCYFTDWKLILQYLPYYNGKFKEEK